MFRESLNFIVSSEVLFVGGGVLLANQQYSLQPSAHMLTISSYFKCIRIFILAPMYPVLYITGFVIAINTI